MRAQWLQGASVVPVVKVASVAFQLFHGRQGVFGQAQAFPGSDVTQIVGAQVGQQRHADVGRRGPAGDGQCRILLDIVGGQPIVLWTNEVGEIAPGSPGRGAQEGPLGGGQIGRRRQQRPADPPADQGRTQPQQQNRRSKQPFSGWAQRGQGYPQQHRQHRADPHLQGKIGRGAARIAAGIGRQLPEQQAAAREQHPHPRTQDRIQGNQRIVGQQDQGQTSQQQGAARGSAGQIQMHQPGAVLGLADQFDAGGEQEGQADHRHHQQGPEPRRPWTQQPTSGQQRQQRRRHQAAAQVVEQLPHRKGA